MLTKTEIKKFQLCSIERYLVLWKDLGTGKTGETGETGGAGETGETGETDVSDATRKYK